MTLGHFAWRLDWSADDRLRILPGMSEKPSSGQSDSVEPPRPNGIGHHFPLSGQQDDGLVNAARFIAAMTAVFASMGALVLLVVVLVQTGILLAVGRGAVVAKESLLDLFPIIVGPALSLVIVFAAASAEPLQHKFPRFSRAAMSVTSRRIVIACFGALGLCGLALVLN